MFKEVPVEMGKNSGSMRLEMRNGKMGILQSLQIGFGSKCEFFFRSFWGKLRKVY